MSRADVLVTEIFSAIQGEATNVGRRQVFVRLTGCPYRCAYCDQPEALEKQPGPCLVEQTAGRRDFETWASPLPIDRVVGAVARLVAQVPHHSVSLTGGEPLMQPDACSAVAQALHAAGLAVCLETAGTLVGPLRTVLPWLAHVSADVKLDSVDGIGADPVKQRRFLGGVAASPASLAVKIVLGPATDDDELAAAVAMVAEVAPSADLFLQPVTPFGLVTAAPTPEQVLRWHDLALHPAPRPARRASDPQVPAATMSALHQRWVRAAGEACSDDAPLVVLVHGTLDRGRAFRRVQAQLATAGIASLAYDRRGYGDSPAEPSTLDTHVADLATLVAELDRAPAAVVGHSFGATVMLAAAARGLLPPAVLGAYEPALAWLAWWPSDTAGAQAIDAADRLGTEAAAEVFLRTIVGDGAWEAMTDEARAGRRREGASVITELRDLRGGAPFALGDVPVGVRLATGAEGPAHLREGVHWLHRELRGAALTELAGAPHAAHVAVPEAFAAWVRGATLSP